jgi:hypothetical protein
MVALRSDSVPTFSLGAQILRPGQIEGSLEDVVRRLFSLSTGALQRDCHSNSLQVAP